MVPDEEFCVYCGCPIPETNVKRAARRPPVSAEPEDA
jgi:hypothetical protein